MSDMRTEDPARIRRYLLGQLAEDEAEAFEERYFAEPELFELVDAVRDELCDEYARGQLSAGDRGRLDTVAGTAEWRRRLRFAHVLAHELRVARPKALSGPLPHAGDNGRFHFREVLRLLWAQPPLLRTAAMFAMLVLAAGWPVSWATSRARRAQIDEVRAASERQLASARQSLESERARSAELERSVAKQTTVEFALFEGMTRGLGESIVIPASASFVRFQLGTEAPLGQKRLGLVIRSADGNTLWSQSVDSMSSTAGSVPAVQIPARVLAGGEYDLHLLDLGTPTPAREIARFHIRVVRR